MSCPFLRNQGLATCDAVQGDLVPSLHEREAWCLTRGAFVSCPSFQARTREGAPIPSEQYYAIWIGDGRLPNAPHR